jgi:hypothetical protein
MITPRSFLPIIAAAALAFATLPAAAQNPQSGQSTQGAQGTQGAKPTQKKKPTIKQDVDTSVNSGTVPARYRSSVPKEYQQYVPFAKPGQ